MSQKLYGLSKTFLVSGTTISAYRVVKFTGTALAIHDTSTAYPLGIIQDTVDPSMPAEVMIDGTSKVMTAEAVTCGDLLTVQTGTGLVWKMSTTSYTHTSGEKVIGIALESGNTNALIEVLIARSRGVQA